MKCALELQTIAAAKAEEIRLREAEAEAKKKSEIFNRTVEYCEQIGKKLEEKANAGQTPEVRFYFNYDWRNSNYGRAMKDNNYEYADGRTSYRLAGEIFDLETMAKWFDRYCFSVSKSLTHVWRYGFGCCKVYHVIICPNPECKK